MTKTIEVSNERKTFLGVILSSILSEPLFTIYGFAAIILRKSLDATAFQISLLTMLKPIVAIFSFYWSSHLSKKPFKLRANFLGAGFFARVPFLLFPFVESSWFLIASVSIYVLFSRAATPAWMEILKINLPKTKREQIFSWGTSISYIEGMILAIGVGSMLDQNPSSWKILFFISALIGMANLYFLSKMPINQKVVIEEGSKESMKDAIIRPWKESYQLMKTRADFCRFQIGFMLSGFSIMLIQPAIPIFFVDTLKISYMEFGIANTLCKGVCIALSSPIWSRLLSRYSIFSLSSMVFFFVGLLPFCLLFSESSIAWFYIAYIFYGIAQGGSHLIWHMSGPTFAGEENSSTYTGVNVMMVGLRGAVAPPLGGALAFFFSPTIVLKLGVLLSVYSCYYMVRRRSPVYLPEM